MKTNIIKKITVLVLAAAIIISNNPMIITNTAKAQSVQKDYILSSELDTIFELYKDKGAYSVAEFTGNYKATTFGDTMVDLYAFSYLYCQFVNKRTDFHGLLYTIEEARAAFPSDSAKIDAAVAQSRKYYAPGKDNSFRYEENVTDVNGVKKDAWFTDAYYRADKGSSAAGGISFGIKDGSRIKSTDNELSFVVEFLDNDNGTIKIQYINTDWTGGKYVGSECTIGKTNTGKWKTVVVPVNNAKFMPESNTSSTALCSGREDFVLKGNNIYVSRVMVIKSDELPPVATIHEAVSYPKQVIVDTDDKDGITRTYNYMQINGQKTVRPYVTSQSWNTDGTKFIVGTTTNQMYEYDTVNETLRYLDETSSGSSLNAVVTASNDIYYISNRCVYKIDWDTYARTLVCFLPKDCNGFSTLSVSDDGRYLSGYFTGSAGGNLARLNLETGTLDKVYNKNFSEENPESQGVGHPIINPEYPNVLFFCNEGTTDYIPDRLWMVDLDNGKMENIFRQSYNYDGTTAECSGHEVWGKNGEYLYFVKYGKNQNKGQNGIVRIPFKDGKFTGEREYINGDAAYWHCFPSGDDNWVAADVSTGEIYLIGVKDHSSLLVADFDLNASGVEHPYQPHPHFSFNSTSINWQMVTDKDNPDSLGAAWVDVSDITLLKDYDKIEYNIGQYAKAKGYTNTKSQITTQVVSGNTFVKAENGNNIYVDIDDSFAKTVYQKAKLTFTAYSQSASKVKVGYTSGSQNDKELHKFEDVCLWVDLKSGTNTYSVDMGYVNLNNVCKYASDMYFNSKSGTTYIKDVSIELCSDYSDFEFFDENSVYCFPGEGQDYYMGLRALSENVDNYSSKLFHVDDAEAIGYKDITAEQVAEVKKAGYSYIANAVDGAFTYKTVTDTTGVTKNAWFTTKNKRVNTTSSYTGIAGQIYFRLTNDTITADDNEVIFTIEYLDNRTKTFNIRYVNTAGNKATGIHTITPTNTGKWKRVSFLVSDAAISSTNSGTGLGTGKGYSDFRIEANSEDLYVSKVILQKPGQQLATDLVYSVDGENISSQYSKGNVSVNATVTNKTNVSSTMNVYVAVFDKFGDVVSVSKTPDTTVASLECKSLTASGVKVDDGDILKVFVWDDELYPYDVEQNNLGFKAVVSGSDTILTWNKYNNSDNCNYKVYCDDKLVTVTNELGYTQTDTTKGKHIWHIEVADSYGICIDKSIKATVTTK